MATEVAARIVGPTDHLESPEAFQAYLEHHAHHPGNREAYRFRDYYYKYWDVPEGARILDLGCYVGATAIHYAELGHEVVGVDGAQAYVDTAVQNSMRNGIAEGCRLPSFVCSLFEDYALNPFYAPFDACCCTEALQQCIDPQVVVQKAYDCLKDGGTFFCTVPAKNEANITQADLAALLKNAGFEIKQLFRLDRTTRYGVVQFVGEGIK